MKFHYFADDGGHTSVRVMFNGRTPTVQRVIGTRQIGFGYSTAQEIPPMYRDDGIGELSWLLG